MVDGSGALALFSGVLLVALGAFLLGLPRRGRSAAFFGGFAVLWGLQVASANLGIVLESPAIHLRSLRVTYALGAVAALFLVHFAARAHGGRRTAAATVMFAATAALAGIVVVAAPHLIVVDVEAVGGSLRPTLGPLAPFLAANFHIAFLVAIGLLYAAYRAARPGSDRHRARGLLAALVLYASYTSVGQLIFFASGASAVVLDARGAGLLVAVFLAGTVELAALLGHLVLRPPPPEEPDLVLQLAFAVPAAVAVAEVVAGTRGTTGLWRLLAVAFVAHALARHRLFDLDLRLRRGAGPVLSGVALLGGVFWALVLALGGAGWGAAAPFALGLVGAGASLAFRDPLGRALFPHARPEDDYVRVRKLEVYRDALADALAAGRSDDDALRALRGRLGLSEREHEAMAVAAATRAPAAAAARAAPGRTLAGRWRVERLLGEGAHGRAFLARDEKDEDVVVKVVGRAALGGRAAAALLREARVLQGLRHPNVVEVCEVVEAEDEVFLVMAYAPGGSVHGLLRRRGALAPSEALPLVDGVLAALEAAHAKGVVHRDVKPENVLLAADGRPLLADFGVAREANAEGTAGAGAVGTLLYMAPEQVRGGEVGPAADLYAVGVLLHLLLTGRHVLRLAGRDDFAVREAVLREPPTIAVKDAALAAVLERALAKDPAARFASAAEMRAALAARIPATT